MIKPVLQITLATATAALMPATAIAQTFPTKVVRLVVPFPAGGSNDVVARALSVPLSKAFGQSVVVENRGGANTIIGTEAVVRSPPDGHTVLVSGFTLLSLAALRSKLPFDVLKDLTAVTRLGTQPFVLSVHPSVPAKTIPELIALARKQPGQLVYSVNGYGTAQHLSGELLKVKNGIDMKLVVFQGGAPSTIAVLGGHASILISTIPSIMQHVTSGKLRPLAVTSRERSTLLKDLPTMMESGQTDFDFSGAMGIFAPSGTPRSSVDRLATEIMRAVQLPEVKDGMMRDGFVVVPLGSAEYETFVRAKIQDIQKVAKAAGIKLD